MQTLKNKVVLITGANRGIGKSLVKASLQKGASKIYATCRDLGKMPNFEDNRVITLELDITNEHQITKVVKQASDTQVLINNAGVLNPGTILDGEISTIKKDMDVNYYGTLNMMRAFASTLDQNSPSTLVNLTSIVAYSPLPSIAGYSASKAALLSATYSVRIELAKRGITVHAVNPGAIDTDMNKGSDWDMPSPDSVAKTILDKVENEELDIIPEDIGLEMFNAWKENPKNLAKMFHKIYHEE
ncbi:SDR family NAD(P)-dependent oxidoreductase [Aquimarina algiphila]|uniref:SDR family NAD(P)-dependent oxidoreductase n=1 Tax=Aquimarina algiphila TaxID=2047982 RepID=UPI00232E27A8|nr:SDR family NAD(P)-dependent oxidoreductase [Aquimarina algiphila]